MNARGTSYKFKISNTPLLTLVLFCHVLNASTTAGSNTRGKQTRRLGTIIGLFYLIFSGSTRKVLNADRHRWVGSPCCLYLSTSVVILIGLDTNTGQTDNRIQFGVIDTWCMAGYCCVTVQSTCRLFKQTHSEADRDKPVCLGYPILHYTHCYRTAHWYLH